MRALVPRICQRPESMLLYGVGYLGLFGFRLTRGPWSVWFLVFAQLWGLEFTPRIKAQRAGKELMQEKDSGAKLNYTGRGLHLRRRR